MTKTAKIHVDSNTISMNIHEPVLMFNNDLALHNDVTIIMQGTIIVNEMNSKKGNIFSS